MRHGDAGSAPEGLGDDGRHLSSSGREQARATGAALASRGVALTELWCSPLVRAVQSAELAAGTLGYDGPVRTRPDLYPDSDQGVLLAALAALPPEADVLVVGHMPYMAAAASAALGLGVGGFSTGDAFRMHLDPPGGPGRSGRLLWRWQGRFLD